MKAGVGDFIPVDERLLTGPQDVCAGGEPNAPLAERRQLDLVRSRHVRG